MPALILPFFGCWFVDIACFLENLAKTIYPLVNCHTSLICFWVRLVCKPYLHKNFGWKCDDCEMRALKIKLEKNWFRNFEIFKTSPLKMCNDLGEKPNVQLGDVQTFV